MSEYSWIRSTSNLRLTLAIQILQAALEKAERLEVAVSIVIVSPSGLAIHTAHMDGAPFQCQEIALKKALTAAGFSAPTSIWEERLRNMSLAVQQGLPVQKGMVLFGGGEPFYWQDELIGAVGVSGATEEQDILCAQAAVEKANILLQGH